MSNQLEMVSLLNNLAFDESFNTEHDNSQSEDEFMQKSVNQWMIDGTPYYFKSKYWVVNKGFYVITFYEKFHRYDISNALNKEENVPKIGKFKEFFVKKKR